MSNSLGHQLLLCIIMSYLCDCIMCYGAIQNLSSSIVVQELVEGVSLGLLCHVM